VWLLCNCGCSDVGHAQILAQLMESDSVFQMSQDKMTRVTAFGTPFKVEIPSHKHWFSTWSMTLQSKGLVQYMDGSRIAGRCVAGVCGVRPGKRLSFSLGAHVSVQAEINFCSFSLHKGRAYRGEHIYICLNSQAALQAHETSRVMSKLVWDC
jgi:hypothetical protein